MACGVGLDQAERGHVEIVDWIVAVRRDGLDKSADERAIDSGAVQDAQGFCDLPRLEGLWTAVEGRGCLWCGGSGSDFAEEPVVRVQSRSRRLRVVPVCPPGPYFAASRTRWR